MTREALTIPEVMALIDLSRSQVFDALAEGQLEACYPGRQPGQGGLKITGESAERYLAEGITVSKRDT